MPTYYTYKDSVPLKPGQTLGYTPGSGYYAKGEPSGGDVISEHGAGGGYTPGDTGYVPTPGMTGSATATGTGYPDSQPGSSEAAGGGGGEGGGSPVTAALAAKPFDYSTDPGYLAALAAEQAGAQQADAALKGYLERQIVRFGDPSLGQALGMTLDPLTAAMAQQNTQAGNSTLAQLQHGRDLSQQSTVNNLAAHGIIQSGDLGYKTGENERAYGTGLYGAQQALLDAASAAQSQTTQQKDALHQNVVNAMTGAYQTYVSNPAFWSYPAETGGQQAAANAQATAPQQAPVAQALAQPQMPGFTAPYKTPASRLGARPRTSPYGGQAARNVRYG